MINRFKPKSEFKRNVLTLMAGTGIAQVIPIALSPIMTRLYEPTDYGQIALFMSIVSLLSVVASGSYEYSILLPKKNIEAIYLMLLTIFLAMAFSVVLFFIILMFDKNIIDLLNIKEMSFLIYIIPITIFVNVLFKTFYAWLNRQKDYKKISQTNVIKSILTSSVNLSMYFSPLNGLVIGYISGLFISVLYLIKIIFKNNFNLFTKINKLKLISLAKKYIKFPKITLFQGLVDESRQVGINMLLNIFYSSSSLGLYSLAMRMLQMPSSLITGSVSQVFYEKISKVQQGTMFPIVKKFILTMMLISVIPYSLLYLFSVDIFSFVFGEKWKISGEIAQVLTPWVFINFVTSPLSYILFVLGKNGIALIISVLYAIVPISTIIFFSDKELIKVIEIISYSMCAILILYLFFILYIVFKFDKGDV